MLSKVEAHTCCVSEVQHKIARLQKLILESKKSGFEHTKSSMGDKYETDREMISQEIEKANLQLQQAQILKQTLAGLPQRKSTLVEPGSLVFTSSSVFYLSVGLGKLKTSSGVFFAISAVSPIGKALLGKAAGNKVTVNTTTLVIKHIA